MEDSSETRTEIIGGAFFVRKKKSHRSERKKDEKTCGGLFYGQAIDTFSPGFSERERVFRGATWINDKELSRYLKLLEGGDGFFYGKSQ